MQKTAKGSSLHTEPCVSPWLLFICPEILSAIRIGIASVSLQGLCAPLL